MSNGANNEEKPSNLDALEDRLYSRTPPPLRRDEEGLSEHHISIKPAWNREEEPGPSFRILATIMPWLKRLFIAAILFFLFAGAVAFYGFFRGGNTVSPGNISLAVLGPVSAAAGEELTFEVTVANYNELSLETVDLIVEYPAGTRKAGDLGTELLRFREALGGLPPGGTVSRRLSAVPFGEEGEKKEVRLSVEYRPAGGSATFSKTALYEFLVSAAPLTVSVSVPSEVGSGQPFEIVTEIVSNASAVIRNLLLKAEYPVGFAFESAAPAPTFSGNIWQLGDLKPQGKRVVQIRGVVEAAEEEERTIRLSVGTASSRDEKALGTVFLTETPSVMVRKPFVGLSLALNGESGKEFVARSAQTLRADILWANNGTAKVTDLEITARLDGAVWNRSSVAPQGGFFDSTTNSISWDKRIRSSFGSLSPGESGTVSFSFATAPVATDPALFKNPEMFIHIFARGKRLDENGAYQDVVSSFSKKIKIASALALGTRLLYNGGPFVNSGSVPPKAEEETTYTIVWSLSNSSNRVSGAKVSAVLPAYVRWIEKWSPASERVLYNAIGGEIVWDAGDIAPGAGFGTSPRELSFQVALLPSLSHIGSSPVIVGEAVAEGDDRFARASVRSNLRPALTTASLEDGGSGAVTQ